MSSNKKTARILEDVKVNVKIKLSALWVTLLLIYIQTFPRDFKAILHNPSKETRI